MVHPSVRDVALFHVKHPERSVTSPQLSLRSRVRSDARPGVPCQGPEARCNPSPMRAITYGVIVNHKRSCSIGSLTAMFHVKREAGSCQTRTGVGLRECRLRGVTVRLPDMLLPAASGQFAPLATTGKGRSERDKTRTDGTLVFNSVRFCQNGSGGHLRLLTRVPTTFKKLFMSAGGVALRGAIRSPLCDPHEHRDCRRRPGLQTPAPAALKRGLP